MRIPFDERQKRDSDVLPLINIVFLMLIFFLLAGTVAPTADFDLTPAESQDGVATSPPAMAVYISEEGFISVAGAEVLAAEVPQALAGLAAQLKGEPLEIVADHRADATLILTVAEAARAAGIDASRLITLRAGAP